MNFNVDCVSTSCISYDETTVGMFVTACNDGGGEYRSVEYTPVDQTGEFVRYHISSGDIPDLGYTDK